MDVALILDSSQWMGDQYRTILVPAAMEFWRALPPKARLTLWTSGGRASRVVDFGVAPEAGEVSLKKIATGGPLFTLEASIAACKQLATLRSERRVVVLVTGSRIPLSQTLLDRTFQTFAQARARPVVVLVKGYTGTGGGMRLGGRSWDTENILADLAKGYGGSYDKVLTAQAVDKVLARAAANISTQYLVRFESAAEKPRQPEVEIKRKGVRVAAGLAMLAY